MKVNLARDILSWQVGKSLEIIEGSEGTAEFVLMMNRWFEIINCGVRNPIRCMEDDRINQLKDFVGYLMSWKVLFS